MMITTHAVMACTKPESDGPKRFRIPKHLVRIRRHTETKKLHNLKKFCEEIIGISNYEQEFDKDLFMRRSDAWKEATDEDLNDCSIRFE